MPKQVNSQGIARSGDCQPLTIMRNSGMTTCQPQIKTAIAEMGQSAGSRPLRRLTAADNSGIIAHDHLATPDNGRACRSGSICGLSPDRTDEIGPIIMPFSQLTLNPKQPMDQISGRNTGDSFTNIKHRNQTLKQEQKT